MDVLAIGETAGKVWQLLAKGDPMLVRDIPRAIGADPLLTQMAVGWLSREDKVKFDGQGKGLLVSLTESELKTLES